MTDAPTTKVDPRFSSPGADATSWDEAQRRAVEAQDWWITTLRSDGSPHTTPLLAVWDEGAVHICTGPEEQKAKNLQRDPRCTLITATGSNGDGLDLIVEGDAVRVTDDARLQRLASAWEAKYGSDWRFLVRDGAFVHAEEALRGDDPGAAYVFAITPSSAFGFRKGDVYSQTRWRF
jgi:hypothetical protein